MNPPSESRARAASTGLVHVRLSDEHEDLARLAAPITALPGPSATAMSLRENYRDPGMRGYLTVAMPPSTPEEDHDANPDD